MAGSPDNAPARDPKRGCEPGESLACDGWSVGPDPAVNNGRPHHGPLAMDVRRLADALGVSPRHVEALHAQGRLPRPVRLGRRRLWPVDEIRHWLEAGAPPREAWERKGGRS